MIEVIANPDYKPQHNDNAREADHTSHMGHEANQLLNNSNNSHDHRAASESMTRQGVLPGLHIDQAHGNTSGGDAFHADPNKNLGGGDAFHADPNKHLGSGDAFHADPNKHLGSGDAHNPDSSKGGAGGGGDAHPQESPTSNKSN